MALKRSQHDEITVVHQTSATTTPDCNVCEGPAKLHEVLVVSNEAADTEYLKLYDDVAPTVGTTEPVAVYMIPNNGTRAFVVDPDNDGLAFVNGISFAVSDAAGKAAGSSPATGVAVTLITEPN